MLATLRAFLSEIGIPTIERALPGPTFLPGLTLEAGAIVVDRTRLLYPGDLLHEAGHVAITPAADRSRLSPTSSFTLGDDLAAIAWSWAALTHLRLDPAVVFHDGGYVGNARAYVENFRKGRYVGVSYLDWIGLTHEPRRNERREPEFPRMLRWLRD